MCDIHASRRPAGKTGKTGVFTMATKVLSLRLVGGLVLVASLVAVSAVATNSQESGAPLDARTVALESWQTHLQQIGWPQDQRERMAPQFLGFPSAPVANEFGGVTVTFDGSRPGMLATVTIVMGANGRPAAKPVVQFGDVLEAQ
jgi:hypothetical protein